ncbi:hypothetical protein Tco_1143965 [Tanacetum coccineum]
MNASFSSLIYWLQETAVHSGENDDDHMLRVHTLYDATVGGEFKHWSAWLFLKGKHKWTTPDSTLQRRNRSVGHDEEPNAFWRWMICSTTGLQRLAKVNVTGSNSTLAPVQPDRYQEFMDENNTSIDRKAKRDVLVMRRVVRPKAVDPISKDCGRTCVVCY